MVYLLGALRDGCLTSQYTIKLKQRNRAWLEDVIVPILRNHGIESVRIYVQTDSTTRYYVAVKNKKLWLRLKAMLEPVSERNSTPRIFQSLTEKERLAFIQGFWDADGGCPKNPNRGKLYIDFTQKDAGVLHTLRKELERMKISSGDVRISEKKPTGHIHRFAIISRMALFRFIEYVGSKHPDKQKRLLQIKSRLSKPCLSARSGEPAAGSPP